MTDKTRTPKRPTRCPIKEEGHVCGGETLAYGMCQKHYRRWLRHGDPRIVTKGYSKSRIDPARWRERFAMRWNYDKNGCHVWVGTFINGKPIFRDRDPDDVVRRHQAQRYIYAKVRGHIPYGYFVVAKCGNPKCVNPDHMEAITRSAFHKNAWAKKRGGKG